MRTREENNWRNNASHRWWMFSCCYSKDECKLPASFLIQSAEILHENTPKPFSLVAAATRKDAKIEHNFLKLLVICDQVRSTWKFHWKTGSGACLMAFRTQEIWDFTFNFHVNLCCCLCCCSAYDWRELLIKVLTENHIDRAFVVNTEGIFVLVKSNSAATKPVGESKYFLKLWTRE